MPRSLLFQEASLLRGLERGSLQLLRSVALVAPKGAAVSRHGADSNGALLVHVGTRSVPEKIGQSLLLSSTLLPAVVGLASQRFLGPSAPGQWKRTLPGWHIYFAYR